jgi:hypothetical protein
MTKKLWTIILGLLGALAIFNLGGPILEAYIEWNNLDTLRSFADFLWTQDYFTINMRVGGILSLIWLVALIIYLIKIKRKTMIIKTSLTADQLKAVLSSSAMLGYSPAGVEFNLFKKARLYGGINEMDFWLVKTPYFGANIPQRFFFGTIIEHDDGVEIKGQFKYTKFTSISLLVFYLLVGSYTFTSTPVDAWVLAFLFQVIVTIFQLLTYFASRFFYKKEEKVVLDLLYDLAG